MKMTIGRKIGVGYALPLAIMVAVGVISFMSLDRLIEAAAWKDHTYRVTNELTDLLTLMDDAETGQRGFLLTGMGSYLEPYDAATAKIGARIEDVRELTADNPVQQQRIVDLKAKVAAKLGELAEAIALRKEKGLDATLPVVLTNQGKRTMDDVRAILGEMNTEEQTLLARRTGLVDTAILASKLSTAGGIFHRHGAAGSGRQLPR